MSHTKSKVPVVQAAQKTCPVCGKRSYSAGGVHPQCAVARADMQQRLRMKPPAAEPPKARPSTKVCVSCEAEMPIGRKQCDCGEIFPAQRAP